MFDVAAVAHRHALWTRVCVHNALVALGLAMGGLFAGSAAAQTPVNITPPNLSGAVAGSLPGAVEVTPSGASHYSIPLQVPPGTAGMAPSLALEYDSQSGGGMLGQGWRVSGQSTITRCGKTVAQDGVRRPVSLDAQDVFCLDGQRLRVIEGSTTEYRTEIDTFSKIESAGGDATIGPTQWTVRTKAGTILTFGGTADATVEAPGKSVILSWALSKLQDRRGNYVSYHYTENGSTGEHYLSRIRYTGNDAGGLTPYNAINFVYSTRPDPWLGYVIGSKLQRLQRLDSIQAAINTAADGSGGTSVRQWKLAYKQSVTSGRSLVESISHCDGAGTSCLPATTFGWTARNPDHNTGHAPGSGYSDGPGVIPVSTVSWVPIGDQVRSKVLPLDLNGDGKADLVYSGGNGTWRTCISTGTSFGCSDWSGPSASSELAVVGDFNGDGKADLLIPAAVGGGNVGTGTLCFSTGSAFNCSSVSHRGYDSLPNAYMAGDFNNDARDDLVVVPDYASSDQIYLCLSSGSGFQPCTPYGNAWAFYQDSTLPATVRQYRHVADFNADGRPDVVQFIASTTTHGYARAYFASDNGYVFGTQVSLQTGAMKPWQGYTMLADSNGDPYDSYADLHAGSVVVSPSQSLSITCRFTGIVGSGGFSCTTQNQPLDVASLAYVYDINDYDGDGRLDVMGAGLLGQIRPDGTMDTQVSFPWGGTRGIVIHADVNGDGLPDTVYYDDRDFTWYLALSGSGSYPDLLSQVTNGDGHVTQVQYKGLHDASVHTAGAAASYPQRSVTAGQALVSLLKVDNAKGGWLETAYSYSGLRTDLLRNASVGFQSVTTEDKVNRITTVTMLSQSFPTTGMPLTVTSTQANGTVLSLTENVPDSFTTAGGAKYPYVRTATVTRKDLNGAPLPIVTTAVNSNGIDAFGNVTSSTATVTAAGETFTTTTTSTYDNLTANWLIGLLRTSSVTKTAEQTGTTTTPGTLVFTGCTSNSPTTVPTAATMTCTLTNSGQTVALSIAYAAPAGTTVAGPANCAANTANCGTVTVTSSTSAGTYAGTLTATPTPAGTAASVSVNLVVRSLPALAFSGCSSTTSTTPTPATMTCTLRNSGQTAASAVAYAAPANTSVTGPSTCAAGSTNCGTVTVTTGTAAGTYSGTLSATPTPSGSAASAAVSLTVNTTPGLTLTGCSSTTTTTPSAATMSCTLGNTGQTAASSVTYSTPANTTVTGPSSCAAGSSNCGTVTVTTGTAAGSYTGTLTATPTPSGSAGSAFVSLTVRTTPALTLSGCSSTSSTTPSAATMSCTLGNTGQTTASSVTYATPANTTVTGPSSCAAGSSNCGTVTVTTGTAAGSYSGTLTATPTPSGSAASTAVSLTVRTAPALTLSSCNSTTTTTPTAATMSCTLGNTGQTSASSVTYSTAASTTVAGPSTCAAGNSNCGTVTVTTGTAAGNYAGTLSAVPAPGGSAASMPINLTVRTGTALTLANCSSTTTTTPTAATMSCTLGNTGQTAASSVTYSTPANTTVAGPSSCAAGSSNCGTVTVTTGTAAGTYSGTLSATPSPSGGSASTAVTLTVWTAPTLTLNACSSNTPTMAPTASTMTCTLANNGQTAATSISYSTPANTSAAGPASCAANTANCGTVTVTSSTAAGSYSGTLSATPTPAGSAGTATVSLTVLTPPTLTLTNCTSTTPTTSPTAAKMTCALGNTAGQTAASSVSYSVPSGTTVSGPSSCAANSNCGTVTVTTSTAAGSYTGTLTATPSPAGSGASASVNLNVMSGSTTVSASPTSVALGTTARNSFSATKNVTVSNTGGVAATISWPLTYTGGTTAVGRFDAAAAGTTCVSGGTLGAGSSCVIAVRYEAFCTAGSRYANMNIQGTPFTTVTVALSGTTSSTAGSCE